MEFLSEGLETSQSYHNRILLDIQQSTTINASSMTFEIYGVQ